MSALRLVKDLPRPLPGSGVAIETPTFGAGTATPTRKGLHVTWDRVRLPEMRRGVAVVDARIGLDAEAAFTPLAVEIRYASGAPLESFTLAALKEGLAPVMRGECLAAGSEAIAARPRETVAALRLVSPDLDEADLSGAVERVIERLDADPRLKAVAAAVDAESNDDEPSVRERLENLSRSLRPMSLSY